MKDRILSIDLGASTAPIVQETNGRNWISYGTDDWANTYPQFLIDLYYNSSTNAAIINATADMIAGNDIVIEDENERDLDRIVKLKQFIANPNGKETLHELVKKLAFDFKLQGGFAINIIWSQDRTQISEIYHVPVEKLRCEKPDKMGRITGYYISADWSNPRQNKPYRVPAFNVNDRTSASQILYSGLYSPNMEAYHTPDYLAGNNWSLIDQKVAEFHLNNIANGFSGSYVFSFANGVPTREERMEVERSLAQKFTGSENAGKFILTFSDDKTRTPEITPISTSDLSDQFLTLQELLVQNILTAHRVTSKTLMGIDSTNGFSSNTDELVNAANFYLNTVVRGFQLQLIKDLRKIFRVNNMDMPIDFVQLKPITVQFDSKTVREVMTTDEIREELGLPALNEDDETVQEKVDFAKVGSMVTDGVELPLYDTIEEAEAEAEKMGCKGHHEHKQDGKTYYMPCESHDQITSLNKCNCKKETNSFTELHKWIDESGEDIESGDWEIVDEENADGEHEDFNFESELNKLVNDKLELASTGTARPNARSTQDGVNDSYSDYYKVRYMYTKDDGLSQRGPTRDFCRIMMNAQKVYRKEDILQLTTKEVNKGWGPKGRSDTYSIWLWKGGGNCHHYFRRVIYKSSLRNAKRPINDDQIISQAKAISEGFTLKRNSPLVAKAPKTMKNNGFLEPR
tara:strand:+ start:600 stop:2660 length:2061 start_codon:yes stop_codon:yes gene_type:complete